MNAPQALVAALVLAVLAIVGGAAGCGPSAESVCDQYCERSAQCFGGTQSDIQKCEIDNKCASPAKNNPDNCTSDSYNKLLSCQSNCYGSATCGQLPGCLIGCGNCIRQ